MCVLVVGFPLHGLLRTEVTERKILSTEEKENEEDRQGDDPAQHPQENMPEGIHLRPRVRVRLTARSCLVSSR